MATAPKAKTTPEEDAPAPAAPTPAAAAQPPPEEQVSAEDWAGLREESLPRKQTLALPGFVKKEVGAGRGFDTAGAYDARFEAYLNT